MEILVDKSTQWFRNTKFPITINGVKKLVAIKRDRWYKTETIRLIENGAEVEVITYRRSNFFKRDGIVSSGSSYASITTINRWRGVFQYIHEGSEYTMCRHSGFAWSAYTAERQIALWDKGFSWVWQMPFRHSGYTILADDDIAPILLITWCLLFSDWQDSDGGIDFGNVVDGVKDIDRNWQPKTM